MDDEKIYNAILDELRANGPRQGLWAKSFTEANGNENAAKALYFKYRAQQISTENSQTAANTFSIAVANQTRLFKKTVITVTKALVIFFLLIGSFFVLIWLIFTPKENITLHVNSDAPTIALNSQTISIKSEKTESDKTNLKQEGIEKTQSLTINEYELAGKAIEKELLSNLHLFKYKIKFGKTIFYSKDETNFYPINYKYSNFLQNDTRLIAKKEFIGDPNKNQPNLVLYSLEGTQGNVPPINYCYRSRDFNTSNYISCFYDLDPRQDPKISLKENLIELSYIGYAKDDSRAGPSIPIIKIFEYIDNEMVCIMGNCEFKDFNHYEHFKKFLKTK